jgi:cytidylate kinase
LEIASSLRFSATAPCVAYRDVGEGREQDAEALLYLLHPCSRRNDANVYHVADTVTVPVITIDGPSGSGKGTISHAVAAALGWHYLDSGSLYRLLAFAAVRESIALNDESALVALADRLPASCQLPEPGEAAILLNGVDIAGELRTEAAGAAASKIAVLPGVRAALLDWQQRCRRPPGLVADGRDMGTVVFPEANLKLFLTASPRVRAERRYKQLKNMNKEVDLESLVADVEARDQRDSSRSAAPLRAADDALVIDNSELSEADTVAMVLEALHKKI